MSFTFEPLEARSLLAANLVVSFYGLGGAGGFGNDWMDKIADKAGESTGSTVRKYGEDQGGPALRDTLKSIDRNRNFRIDKAEVAQTSLRVIGYSFGAIQAANFARNLLKVGTTVKGYLLGVGVPIRSLVALDPVQSIIKQTDGVPRSVNFFSNYYQQKGGNTKVDLYTRTTPSVKVRSITVNDPENLKGETLPSDARHTKQIRIDTELAGKTVRHKVEDFLDGKLKGSNVNHGTVPFFAYDYALSDLIA